jgi:hypothetical protein
VANLLWCYGIPPKSSHVFIHEAIIGIPMSCFNDFVTKWFMSMYTKSIVLVFSRHSFCMHNWESFMRISKLSDSTYMILNYETYDLYVELPFWSYKFCVYGVLKVGPCMHVVPNLKEEWIPPSPAPSGGALYIMFENHVRSWPLLKTLWYTRGYMSRYLCR